MFCIKFERWPGNKSLTRSYSCTSYEVRQLAIAAEEASELDVEMDLGGDRGKVHEQVGGSAPNSVAWVTNADGKTIDKITF